ncbi:MAG TPA: carbon storage regulator CsrA [Spirochaetota bacterium]|nr:carbon storage regulator CsrA [Spirochaetota bacterium]
MLVLARRLNESIIIGDDIEVVVIDIKGDQVKLGIRAPKRISVHRKEIYDEIQQENIAAMGSNLRPEALKNLSDFLSGGAEDGAGDKGDVDSSKKGKD